MADSAPVVPPDTERRFSSDRVTALLNTLEVMASGNRDVRLPISPFHDELDAIAHGINVLVGELSWSNARAREALEEQAAELRAAVASAQRANAAKSIFLSNMSHEVRTPVAAMMGFADLLENELSHKLRAHLVRRLRANGHAVLSVLGDLLDLARLETNKIELTLERVSVGEVIDEVVASAELQARAKGVGVRVALPRETQESLWTDRFRLRQILVNLLSNAVKFTGAGGIVVSARVESAADGGGWVIDVADTGIGIAEDRHQHVFELFEQADPSIARIYGGVGLGLALSRRLAEQLGGSLILLRSAPGEGATFRLAIKSAPRADHSPAGPEPEAFERSPDAIAGMRILLAEDHDDMRLAVRMLLEQSGASVDIACDGREAIAKVLAERFDLVLMDLRMPYVDGLEATRKLRAQGCTVPIIALTADPTMVDQAAAIEGGCNECLAKPFLSRDLIVSILRLRG